MRVKLWSLLLLCALVTGCHPNRLGEDDVDADGGTPPAPDLAMSGPFADFPASPILDTGGPSPVPGNAGDLFGPAGSGAQSGGPCLIDPELGALVPRNWLRLRFRYRAPGAQNLFEIRLHADNQINDLVVYTTATTYTLPADLWDKLTAHSADRAIQVTVRGGELMGGALVGMPALGSSGELHIAPVDAPGTIVYWTTSAGTVLRGFKVGEESVRDVLKPAQSTPGTMCIGCHSSTPDGEYVAFSQTDTPTTGDPATLSLRSLDGRAAEPPFLTAAARALLARQQQQLPTFSAAHWRSGDRTLLSILMQAARYEIVWTDLEATAQTQGVGWGIVARTGDTRMAAAPVFGHNGDLIAYVSGTTVQSGVTTTDGDLYVVPYNGRAGGRATPVSGASSPSHNEYYPAFSPDDELLAFTRIPIGQSSYNNGSAELFVIPTNGGTATRLAANDPPACAGAMSPGVLNSWPKWAPELRKHRGRQFYWLSFSSVRSSPNPQLYVTGVVIEEDGSVKTYKALHLWNQPANEGNHTAAWDVFKIIVG